MAARVSFYFPRPQPAVLLGLGRGLGVIVSAALVLTCTSRPGQTIPTPSQPAAVVTAAPSSTFDPLDIRHRDTLRVCLFVDPVVQVDTGAALETLTRSIKDLRERQELRSFVDVPMGEISLCPSVPQLIQGGKHPQIARPGDTGPPPARVAKADVSPFALWLVMTTASRIDLAFGTVTPHAVAEQIICASGSCAEVTTSFYVTSDEFNDPDKRRRAIRLGLGG